MDVSSEMIHALLPLYLVTVLGTSTLTVGIIEGIAEATASITKVFSGALSDYLGKRKWLAAVGYGLAAVTKPVFPLALEHRLADGGALRRSRRQGHPRRAARRADRRSHARRICAARAFGLRQSLDTIGAVLGPLLAIVFMAAFANNFTPVFWIAVIPAFVSVAIIVVRRARARTPPGLRQVRAPLARANSRGSSTGYWIVVGVAAIFTLARFSEAFLLLRAQSVGLAARPRAGGDGGDEHGLYASRPGRPARCPTASAATA